MGNTMGGKKKAKVTKIDGTTFRPKSPAYAGDFLREHPGHDLLESEEVKRLGVQARPLGPDVPLKPGKLYFLVELPRLPNGRVPRRAWSGALQGSGAKDRLESLKLSRRSVSDISLAKPPLVLETASGELTQEGAMRLRVRLPKAQVEKLMVESKDSSEAAAKIAELYVAKRNVTPPRRQQQQPASIVRTPGRMPRMEKRTRFMAMTEEVTV